MLPEQSKKGTGGDWSLALRIPVLRFDSRDAQERLRAGGPDSSGRRGGGGVSLAQWDTANLPPSIE